MVALDDDDVSENTGEIMVTLNADPATPNFTYKVGSTATATTMILDDDAPVLAITGGAPVTEGDNVMAVFTITAEVLPSGGTVAIDYTPVKCEFLSR